MFNWIKQRRERKLAIAEAERKLKASEEKQIDLELQARGVELKEALIKAGIHPFNRINRNISDKYVFMYGVLNGRLVKAEMGIRGYLLMSYVKEE